MSKVFTIWEKLMAAAIVACTVVGIAALAMLLAVIILGIAKCAGVV
jgi:hypothetical protein